MSKPVKSNLGIEAESPDKILLGYDQGFDEKKRQEKFPDIIIERYTAYNSKFFNSSKF